MTLTPRQAFALYVATRRGMQLYRIYGPGNYSSSVNYYVQNALSVYDQWHR